MDILIIGGTGNISKYVVNYFVNKGCKVTVINRGNRNYFELPGVTYIYCDINNVKVYGEKTRGLKWDKIIDFTVFDCEHIKNRINTCIPNCEHYVFISSIASYKQTNAEIYYEDSVVGNTEWEYGFNKYKVEEELLKYSDENPNFKYTFIRPGLTYSELWVPDTVHDSCCNPGYSIHRILCGQEMVIYNDKNWHYTFMHAEDFAHNLYELILKPESINNIFNMVGEEHIYPIEVLKYLGKYLNKNINIVEIPYDWAVNEGHIGIPVQHQHSNYSNGKIKNLLGAAYVSTDHLEETVKKYVDLFEEHQELMWWDGMLRKEIEQMLDQAERCGLTKRGCLDVADLSKPERFNSKLYVGMCRKIANAKA